MGEYLLAETEKRFQTQTKPNGEQWSALSPSYQRRKRKNASKILTLEGFLSQNLRYQVTTDELLIGSNAPYAAHHQFGAEWEVAARSQQVYFRQHAKTGEVGNRFVNKMKSNFSQWVSIGAFKIRIPARPFLGTSDSDDRELVRIAQDYLRKALDSNK